MSNSIPQAVREQISRRAYELYLSRGKRDGLDLDDWFRAEQEILNNGYSPAINLSTSNATPKKVPTQNQTPSVTTQTVATPVKPVVAATPSTPVTPAAATTYPGTNSTNSRKRSR